MTALQYPREWASSGTKTDPGAAMTAAGFVAGHPAAAAHFNHVLNQHSIAAREVFRRACYPRRLSVTSTDTSGFLAAVSQGAGKPVVLGTLHTGVPLVTGEHVSLGGAVASISVSVRSAARNPTTGRLVLVGSGGTHNCTSTDNGANWSAGGALGGVGFEVLWNPTYSRFQAIYASNARYSTDAASWTNVAVSGAAGAGMALLSNGNVLHLVGAPDPSFQITTNGGTSWGAAAGTVSYAASVPNKGHLHASGQSTALHAVLHNDGTIRVAASSDGQGATWAQVASISPPAALTFSNATFLDIRIRQCPDTNLVALACLTSAGGAALYASADGGSTWCDPWLLGIASVQSLQVAGGRIYLADSAGGLYASDGVA